MAQFKVGSRVMFRNGSKGMVYGTVKRINLKSVTLEECSDGPRGWRVGPYMLSAADSHDPGAEAANAPAGERPWRKGDRVEFNFRGEKLVTGTITRINSRTCSIDPDEPERPGQYYRVSPRNLRPASKAATATAPVAPPDTTKKDKAEWARWSKTFGFEAEDFGKTFKSGRTDYRITAINPRRPKYPVSAVRVRDGRAFKFGADTVRRALGRTLGGTPAPVFNHKDLFAVGTPVTYKALGTHNKTEITGVITKIGNGTYEVYGASDIVGVREIPQISATKADRRDKMTVLWEINGVYTSLSPENLTCDGERPRSQVRTVAARLRRALKALFVEYGREVDEATAWSELEKLTA